MRRFRPLTYANVMSSIAVFLALGGGAYAAVGSIPGPDGVIHGCYQKKKGNLRLVPTGKRCSGSEKAIAFNQQGRAGNQGIRGIQGAQGVPGAKGEQGPQGPGATTFTETLSQAEFGPIVRLNNGIIVNAVCTSGGVQLEFTSHSLHMQITGTSNSNSFALAAVEVDNSAAGIALSGTASVEFDVIARDPTVGSFAHIDVHGTAGSPCKFWGMIIPSS